MKELQIKEICQEIIDKQTKCNYSVEYILKNKDDIVRAVAVNKHTKSTIQLDIVDGRNHTQNLDYFNFNPDLFLFSDLEREYEKHGYEKKFENYFICKGLKSMNFYTF